VVALNLGPERLRMIPQNLHIPDLIRTWIPLYYQLFFFLNKLFEFI
jgi:hypothetical protein